MKWFVLYTKSNYERKVSEGLNSIGITNYCPTYTTVKHYSDRKKKVEKPLLQSYVLVQIHERDREKVFTIPGVVRYVFWLGKPAEVRPKEIEALKRNLNGVFEEVSISQIHKGESYTIPAGPLQGKKGTVLEIEKKKVKLELESLGILVTLKLATA
jgi:transcription antitermination factor NusG